LKGRTAVITGASRGIGAGLAESFAGHGMRLGLCSRSAPVQPGGDDVVSRIVDVRDEAGKQRFTDEVVERFGAIDLWINNAGVLAPIAPLRDIELEAFREHIDINLSGVFLGSRCYVRHVRSHEGPGVLINVSSGAACQCIALEEASAGLRAHAVAPGVVDTDMQAMIRSSSAEDFPSLERFLELKRDDGFNSIGFVASFILALAFDLEQQTDEVDIRVPNEKE
jgi:NAD(P)-dependent dehydrogenase (short-subunit alcohol dehydrogenase family)